MKIKKTIFTAAILMAAVCLPAQNKSAGINISIWKDICTQPHDSTQTTYVNIGLLSTMNRLNGVGINALGSVVHGDMSTDHRISQSGRWNNEGCPASRYQ